jgi:hypothetical protein
MVRVIRQPTGSINSVALAKYRAGQTYDFAPLLADFLILEGYAISEMRQTDRRSRRRPEAPDRRKTNQRSTDTATTSRRRSSVNGS